MNVIGVMPLWDGGRDSMWMLPGYFDGIIEAGGVPFMLPLTDSPKVLFECLRRCDGFLLTGGDDVDPGVYGASRSDKCGKSCETRDLMEKWMIGQILKSDKPLLGICRGIQILNAVLGGTLYQDLPTEYPSSVNHCMTPPYDRAVHRVSLVDDTPLQRLLGVKDLGVNSYHHQAVKIVAPSLEVEAWSEDGLCEAVRVKDAAFAHALQWHPEFSHLTDENSRKIFAAFVEACAH